MKYFKNTELAKLYHVSEKSVRNWIESAKNNKLQLQLHTIGDRAYIADTMKNTIALEELAVKGKKFRNSRGLKVVSPKKEFYSLYSQKQILEIIKSIDIHHEIPYQYNFFGEGVEYWDKYTNRLVNENIPSILTTTIHLIDLNLDYIDDITKDYTMVNVVDVGIGNSLPSRKLLQHLIDQGKLKRYIGLDISHEMLDLAKKNTKEWFGEKIKFEGYVRDMMYDRFDDLLIQDTFGQNAPKTLNIVMLLGCTIYNLREPHRALRTVSDSMGANDLLITDEKLDSEKSRRYFDFSSSTTSQAPVFRGKALLDLLNIDSSFYTLEQIFVENEMMRQSRVKLDVALQLEFELGGKKRVVDLNKNDRLLIWRVWHFNTMTTMDLFESSKFNVQQITKSQNQEFLLLTAKIKHQ